MSEEVRKAFEAWHGGVYRGHQEEIAWAAWSASREQMREEAVKAVEARYMGDNNREDMEARRCADAIRSLP